MRGSAMAYEFRDNFSFSNLEVIGGGDYNSDGTDDYIIAAPDDF
jgi:hypothetical protein